MTRQEGIEDKVTTLLSDIKNYAGTVRDTHERKEIQEQKRQNEYESLLREIVRILNSEELRYVFKTDEAISSIDLPLPPVQGHTCYNSVCESIYLNSRGLGINESGYWRAPASDTGWYTPINGRNIVLKYPISLDDIRSVFPTTINQAYLRKLEKKIRTQLPLKRTIKKRVKT